MTIDYAAHLQADSDRFRAVLTEADPGLRVPSCPDWSADDLLWHLGEVQWFWGTIVSQRLTDADVAEDQKPERPESHDGLLGFFDTWSAVLRSTLAETDPAVEVWMWGEDKSVGYVARRQAHEALIHRLDAELTLGDPSPLDAVLATDGIDEAMTVMYGGPPVWATVTPGDLTLSLVTSDTGLTMPLRAGHWAGTSPNTGKTYDEPYFEVVAAQDVSSATVSATAGDLDAWLWGRAPDSVLTVTGDAAAFDLLRSVVGAGID